MNKFEKKEIQIQDFINDKKNDKKGRKAITKDKKKNNVISIYLNDNDYLKVKEQAEKARLPISQYITSKIFQEN